MNKLISIGTVVVCVVCFGVSHPVASNAASLEEIAARLARIEKDNAERISNLERENKRLRTAIEKLTASKKGRGDPPAQAVPPATSTTESEVAIAHAYAQAASSPATTTSMPAKAPWPPVAYSRGPYGWLDGSYQAISLPTQRLGVGGAAGPFDSLRPRLDGFGVSGGVGYVLAPAWSFGSDLRVELGGAYVQANGKESGGSTVVAPGITATPQHLNGLNSNTGTQCVFCQTATTLDSDYKSWRVQLRLASDARLAALTLTSSIAAFGGVTDNKQRWVQTLSVNVPLQEQAFYSANTALRWSDRGGKVGLDAKYDIADWVAVTLGGSVGWSARHTDFNGSDISTGNIGGSRSSIAATEWKSAFLANLETSVLVHTGPWWAWRIFAGLNYDGSVPGISPPSNAGTIGVTGRPATIVYSSETSYYAGAGVRVRFGDAPASIVARN